MSSRFVSGGTIAGTGGSDASEPPQAQRQILGLGHDQRPGAAEKRSSSDDNNSAAGPPRAGTNDAGSGSTRIERQEKVGWGTARDEVREGEGEPRSKTSVEWEAVQKDLEEERKRRADARRVAVEGGSGAERSLYEILQANKAAKQAAFEEQNRIRNQFRALDDDEIEFLHGVSDEKHAEEERVRRETEERLASFRKAQMVTTGGVTNNDADGDVGDDITGGDAVAEEWTAGTARKRKRDRDREKEKHGLKGVKRVGSVSEDKMEGEKGVGGMKRGDEKAAGGGNTVSAGVNIPPAKPAAASKPELSTTTAANGSVAASMQAASEIAKPKPKPALGLADYGSDDDDD
ncbi:hypothetical protein F4777DRAFT_559906 [Nemania sp. FL0916]|nr:hypothetical protein F4777DRAFT_559906 [Nemania sp. FL0916]